MNEEYTIPIPDGTYSFQVGRCRNLEVVVGRTFVNGIDVTESVSEVRELERLWRLG